LLGGASGGLHEEGFQVNQGPTGPFLQEIGRAPFLFIAVGDGFFNRKTQNAVKRKSRENRWASGRALVPRGKDVRVPEGRPGQSLRSVMTRKIAGRANATFWIAARLPSRRFHLRYSRKTPSSALGGRQSAPRKLVFFVLQTKKEEVSILLSFFYHEFTRAGPEKEKRTASDVREKVGRGPRASS